MDASIIIRTKNEEEYIEHTLTRIYQQEFGGNYEIIIVDSGSTDSTLNIVKKYDVEVLHILQEEFSYGRSLNLGASRAKGEFVVNLSAHAVPKDRQWLRNLLTGFDDENVAGTYGRQFSVARLNPFEALQNERFFGPTRIVFSMKDKNMLRHISFSNSNASVRRVVWERFKFRESVPYAEDALWQREVIRAGFSISYVPDAAVYHTHEVSIYGTYKNSKNCAYALALMNEKRQSILLGTYDLAVFLLLTLNSMLQNLEYIWRHNHYSYLRILPCYVLSRWLGWLAGTIKYRMQK